MARSPFIVIEGLDGSGGTTQSRLLKEWLLSKGLSVHLTCEPSNGPIGEFIRETLSAASPLSELGNETLPYLFAADRRDHIDREIIPAMEEGKWVVSDRYYHSSLAYQGLDAGLPLVAEINAPFRAPDICFFLWLSPEVSFKRVQMRGEPVERFETLEHLRTVAEAYESVLTHCRAKGEKIIKIDASGSIQDIHKLIIGHVSSLMEK